MPRQVALKSLRLGITRKRAAVGEVLCVTARKLHPLASLQLWNMKPIFSNTCNRKVILATPTIVRAPIRSTA